MRRQPFRQDRCPDDRWPAARQPRRALARAMATALVLTLACSESIAPPAPPHGIVLIALDTLRGDALSATGNARPTSPILDGLARDGVLFENAISSASFTLPAFVGILSGSYFSKRTFHRTLQHSLVESLRNAGYATAAFTEGGYVSRRFGFDRGFDHFWEEKSRVVRDPSPDTGIARTFGLARDWLRENGSVPFFLFIHTYEVHVPYQRRHFAQDLPRGVLPEIYDLPENFGVVGGRTAVGETEIAYVRALYDGGVVEADTEVGGLLTLLDEVGVSDRTIVAITSDHGEALGERNPSDLGRHGHALWDTLLRVPLIIRDPRRPYPVSRVAAQVRTIDVLPTLLDLASLPTDPAARGRSLLPMMLGEREPQRVAYAEISSYGKGTLQQAALRTDRYKLILRTAQGTEPESLALYDLGADPGEHVDMALERPDVVAELDSLLRGLRSEIDGSGRAPMRPANELGDELEARLEALGYIAK